ncbi:hypothetical protein CBS147343_9717 [Aspergillus niger]|nr:hypothetical protein CBS147343_9717 [Aspergillus niger]
MASVPSVQCFGKKKTATAVAHCKDYRVADADVSFELVNIGLGGLEGSGYHSTLRRIMKLVDCPEARGKRYRQGKGMIRVNGQPLSLVQPEILRFKVYEPLLIVGADKFAGVDIRVRVSGGGHTSQVYAIRQAIAKSIVAYYQKYVDEHSKNQLKQALVQYDRTLLVADNRRTEPKKFGGRGARARYQKSYR